VLSDAFLYMSRLHRPFLIGGLSGSDFSRFIPFDHQVTDSDFVVATSITCSSAARRLPDLAAFPFWAPELTCRLYHEGRGTQLSGSCFVGFQLASSPYGNVTGLPLDPRPSSTPTREVATGVG